jgi:hypothetical protein
MENIYTPTSEMGRKEMSCEFIPWPEGETNSSLAPKCDGITLHYAINVCSHPLTYRSQLPYT